MSDSGARCDRHVGEVFPPRCYECTALQSTPATEVPPVDNSSPDLVASALASWGITTATFQTADRKGSHS